MSNIKKLNVNSTVKVKLTEEGLRLLKDEHFNFWEDVYLRNMTPEKRRFTTKHQELYTDPKPDENGYYIFQLWTLMEKFGSTFCLGCEPYFMEILIEDKELE